MDIYTLEIVNFGVTVKQLGIFYTLEEFKTETRFNPVEEIDAVMGDIVLFKTTTGLCDNTCKTVVSMYTSKQRSIAQQRKKISSHHGRIMRPARIE